MPTRTEIDAVRTMPTGHAKNVALIELMQRARAALPLTGTVTRTVVALDRDRAELLEAAQLVRRLGVNSSR